MLALEILNEQLKAAGVPFVGLSAGLGNGVNARIDFDPSATQAQINTGNAILAGFNWRDTVRRSLPSIVADIGGLSTANRQKLIDYCLATWLIEHPKAATAIGINIPGEA